ncbi:MAG: type IV toxin-antitoxin system AbiEi family antitoxin domain-containing protein [Bacillota bacterium]
MSKYETIRDIFKAGDNIATTRQMLAASIHTSYIAELVESGIISRIKRGVYEWTELGRKSDVEIISRLIPDAILCMETMLHHYGYTDRTPDGWHIAVDKRLNRKRLKIAYPPLRVHYVVPSYLEIGVSDSIVDGVRMRVYDRERTICDVIRNSSKIEQEVVTKAIQAYVRDRLRNVIHLMEYARRFRIHKKVGDLVGVWM